MEKSEQILLVKQYCLIKKIRHIKIYKAVNSITIKISIIFSFSNLISIQYAHLHVKALFIFRHCFLLVSISCDHKQKETITQEQIFKSL